MTSDTLPGIEPTSGSLPLTEPEVKIAAGDTGTKIFLFKNKKFLKAFTYSVLTLGITIPTVLSVVLYLNLSNVNIRLESLEAAFRSGQLSQLSSSVASLEKHVAEQDGRFALKDDVSESIKLLSGQISSLSDTAGEIAHDSAENRQIILRQDGQLNSFQSSLDTVQSAIQTLNKFKASFEKSVASRPAVTATEEKKQKSNIAKKTQRSARTVPLAAPFILTGIERRGGQVYAVVAPRGSTTLSEMQLLAPGDSAWGWTLRSTEGNEAFFTVNGIQQRLTAN